MKIIENKKHVLSKQLALQLCDITSLRAQRRLTQKELEMKSGVKQPMIARIENGEVIPRVDTLLRLLSALDLTLVVVPVREEKS